MLHQLRIEGLWRFPRNQTRARLRALDGHQRWSLLPELHRSRGLRHTLVLRTRGTRRAAAARGKAHRLAHRHARLSEVRDPVGHTTNAKTAAKGVAEVATVVVQEAVVVRAPLRFQAADDLQHMTLRDARAAHGHGLKVCVLLTASRPATEDAGAFIAPLPVMHLHPAVEGTSAQHSQDGIGSYDLRGFSTVVDVERDRDRVLACFTSSPSASTAGYSAHGIQPPARTQ
mmetsp:Transcript_80919/g.187947  ORF Transcript_80919/g.187947 Transcript_80919/m.187947 type:complete len:229 (+) Transcript_80919:223-909(+)